MDIGPEQHDGTSMPGMLHSTEPDDEEQMELVAEAEVQLQMLMSRTSR